MKELLIGRDREARDLKEWIGSQRSEFIAIYGRRRVGKTFLVKKVVGDNFLFHFSGSYGEKRKTQLLNFTLALKEQCGFAESQIPENWTMAFYILQKIIESSKLKEKIIFLDELPWLDTPKSGFISALEFFWNNFCAWRDDVKLIVCGSATSWIINKLINNKGGLHNRLTHRMQLRPFNLKQSEEYFKAYGFRFNRLQIAECYMVMGGIPYYFSLMNRGESLAANIDWLLFNQDAPLKNEFNQLYRALFKNYLKCIEVIKALAVKGIGLTRQEILKITKMSNNGEFSKILEDLELCDFIRSYQPFETGKGKGNTSKNSASTLYQLIDFYTLFYLRFNKNQASLNEHFWQSSSHSPQIIAWRGITFEMLCLCHAKEIKKALGIADVSTRICSWMGKGDNKKVQIDLLIDRTDATINLCEMKFSFKEFVIDKAYAQNLEGKVETFIEETGTRKNVLLTLITSCGLVKNQYSHCVQRELSLDALF